MPDIKVSRFGAEYELWDADHDTGVQVESQPDDDAFRVTTSGTERLIIDNVGDLDYTGDNENNVFFIDASNDSVAILTKTTEYTMNGSTVKPSLTMKRLDSGNAVNQLLLAQTNTNTRGAFNIFARARDSGGTAIAALSGDRIGIFRADAHDGTEFITGGSIAFQIGTTVSTGIIPTSINFQTMDDAGSIVSRMFIRYDGNVGIGTASPGALLDVRGSAVFNQDGADFDFRVESLNYANMFRINAGLDQVQIGTGTAGAIARFDDSIIEFNRLNNDIDFQVRGDLGNNVLYVNAGTNGVGFNTDTPQWTREGSTISSAFLAIKPNVANVNAGAQGLFSSAAARATDFSMLKASGSEASPAAVTSNHVISNIIFEGHDGTDFNNSAGIRVQVNGSVSANTVPMEMRFQTSETNSGGLAARMTIKADGKVGIGTTGPDTELHVVGETKTEGGRIREVTRVTTSPYTILASDHEVFVNTDSSAVTVNLPAGVEGTNYRIINTGSSGNDVTITPNGAELLTGANSSKTISDGTVIILTYETNDGWW